MREDWAWLYFKLGLISFFFPKTHKTVFNRNKEKFVTKL